MFVHFFKKNVHPFMKFQQSPVSFNNHIIFRILFYGRNHQLPQVRSYFV